MDRLSGSLSQSTQQVPLLSFWIELVVHRWENHKAYVQAIRDLRLKELRCESRMAAVRCGLSSVVPLHVLTVMTPLDMEIRTCGQPSLDLGFLKVCYLWCLVIRQPKCHLYYIVLTDCVSLCVKLTILAYNLIVACLTYFCFRSSGPHSLCGWSQRNRCTYRILLEFHGKFFSGIHIIK